MCACVYVRVCEYVCDITFVWLRERARFISIYNEKMIVLLARPLEQGNEFCFSFQIVKVGNVSTYRSATKTIKQPVYLRQGYGIFLKKHLKPR